MKINYTFTMAAILFLILCSVLVNVNYQATDLVMKVNLITLTMLLFGIGVVLVILLEVVYMSKKILREHLEE